MSLPSNAVVYRGSMLSNFHQCQMLCYYRWFHDPPLEPKKVNDNTSIGTILHGCEHLWYKHVDQDTASRELMIEAYLASDEVRSKFEEKHVVEARRLMTAQIELYPEEDFDILSPEKTIVLKMHRELPLYFKLTVDGIIQLRAERSPVMVLEHKTSSVARGPIIKGYLRSPQIISYCWAVRNGLGYPVVGALYNFLVKTTDAQCIRMPAAVGKPLQQRWLKSFYQTVAMIEERKEGATPWIQNLGHCYTIMGECPYLPLCTNYSDTSLRLYRPADEDADREELVINNGGHLT